MLVCVIFYWKLGLSPEYVWFNHPDMCYIEIPRLQFQAREMHAGRFPLWTTGIWMGQPLLGQTQPGPVFPLNLAFLLLPLRNGYIDLRLLNWYYILTHCIAAVGAYLLYRDLRRSRIASVTAAFAFTFGGFIGTVAWLDVLNGAIWTPLICLFFLRAVRGRRPWSNSAFCGLTLGVAWLSGHHEIPLLVSYALAGGYAFAIWRRGRAVIPAAATTFAVGALVAAVQVWPTAEFGRQSRRWVGLEHSFGWKDSIPYIAPTLYSLPVRALPGIAIDDTGNYADSTPFMGMVAVSFGLLGIYTSWRSPVVRWMTVLTAGALVFSIGAATPIHGLIYSFFPVMGKARVPVRAIHLFGFGTSVLIAYGFDSLRNRERLQPLERILLIGGGVLLAGQLWRPSTSDGIVLAALVAVILAALITAWKKARISYASLSAGVLLLMLLELYPVGTRTYVNAHSKEGQRFVRSLTDNADVVEFLQREPAPRRVAVNDSEIPTNFGDWHGFDGVEGYVAGVSENLTQVPRHTRAIQNLYGVTHYIGREPLRPEFQAVFTGASGVRVWRNPEALPRAWSVHRTQQVAARTDVDAQLSRDGFDPRQTAIFAGDAPSLEVCQGDEVQILARAPNRIRLKAEMKCRGLVVLSETWYPGWVARVDRRDTPVLETFGAIRGVVVDAGEHSVELSYEPMSVYGGAALTLIGLLSTGLIVVWEFRSKRARRKQSALLPLL